MNIYIYTVYMYNYVNMYKYFYVYIYINIYFYVELRCDGVLACTSTHNTGIVNLNP